MDNQEIFSFHLTHGNFLTAPRISAPGLMHAETLFTMQLGSGILKPSRYGFSNLVYLARWKDEDSLVKFLETSALKDAWHVRLKFYRRWGSITELDHLPENSENHSPEAPVVGITLARLKITETLRFLKWGKPVEGLVRDHPGKLFALAAMRPLNTLSTFSIWKTEKDMIAMVKGDNVHGRAIGEQMRRSFHHEFTTMRFYLLSEHGKRPA